MISYFKYWFSLFYWRPRVGDIFHHESALGVWTNPIIIYKVVAVAILSVDVQVINAPLGRVIEERTFSFGKLDAFYNLKK